MAREAWGMAHEYPIVELTTHGAETVPHAGVDLDTLREQLVPVRDALLELFEGGSSKRGAVLQRLEVGLSVTKDGRVAFAMGNATASFTLSFERRQPAPRSAKTRATREDASDERRTPKAAARDRERRIPTDPDAPQAPAESVGKTPAASDEPDLIRLD